MICRTPDNNFDKINPEEHLWRQVLHQVIKDAIGRGYSLDRYQAREWIFSSLRDSNRDFLQVCDLAGLDVNYVKGVFQNELSKAHICEKR